MLKYIIWGWGEGEALVTKYKHDELDKPGWILNSFTENSIKSKGRMAPIRKALFKAN